METDLQLDIAQRVGERERHFEWILGRRDLVRRDAISNRSAVGTKIRGHIHEELMPKKTMRAAPDLAAAIEAPLILQPMQKVAHHGRVIPPPARRLAEVVVAMKKANP